MGGRDSTGSLSGLSDEVYTVTEITEAIRQSLESEFPSVQVIGEVANFKAHTSGHIYFSLRDGQNLLRIVLFRRYAANIEHTPEDGMLVIASGRISHYGGSGQTQLLAFDVIPAGRGVMELAFRRLLQKLMAEGLTSPQRKRAIPPYPERIAVITSPTGAVIRDILDTLKRRWPVAEVVHIFTEVQGPAAGRSIGEAFDAVNGMDDVDVVILARGGGSIEDLWTFNTEEVARAVAGSVHPVITGIGHEIDTTIADFVSDLRAATPTAAAELATPVIDEVIKSVEDRVKKVADLHERSFRDRLHRLDYLLRSSAFPVLVHRLERSELRVDERCGRLAAWWERERSKQYNCSDMHAARLETALARAIRRFDSTLAKRLAVLAFCGPGTSVTAMRERLVRLEDSLRAGAGTAVDLRIRKLDAAVRTLRDLHPANVLARGYTYCTSPDGDRIIGSVRGVRRGGGLTVNFKDGGAACRVEGKRKGRSWPKR